MKPDINFLSYLAQFLLQ